ncbi:solute carrier family 13 (sodium-dependent dicarboxylate transporter), member 2/3/5, partial [Candidatus Hakubella thermalkaliphila]
MSAKEMEAKPPEGLSPPPPETTTVEVEKEAPPKSPKFVLSWFLIAIAVGVAISLLPTPGGLSERGHNFLALLVTVLILWTTECVPIGITAL